MQVLPSCHSTMPSPEPIASVARTTEDGWSMRSLLSPASGAEMFRGHLRARDSRRVPSMKRIFLLRLIKRR